MATSSGATETARSPYLRGAVSFLLVAAMVVVIVLVMYNLIDDNLDNVRTGNSFLSSMRAR